MNDNNALIFLLNKNPDLAERLAQQVKEVKKDKARLMGTVESYSQKYSREIEEGTKKRQLLLAEGKSRGLSEKEIFSNQAFMPTKYTPILNFLYFILRERPAQDQDEFEKLRREYNEKYGHLEHDDYQTNYDAFSSPEAFDQERQRQNERYGTEYEDEKESFGADKTPQMEEFIYGNMTHEMFQKIKKLKSLSKSPNENEAFQAYRRCLELCQKYHLDFDKVPCNNK